MENVLIRNRTRNELACELCEWTWLVPIDAGVYEVIDEANKHWREEHPDE